jgi:hypothetical protein
MTSKKAQMGGIITVLISIIIIVAVLLPVVMNISTPSTAGTLINNTYTFSNSQGTASNPLNTYINSYKNANVTEYSTATSANFTGKTNGTSAWLKLYVNGAATTTNFHKGTSYSNATYSLNYSAHTTYKFTVSSNESGYANTTYWLILKAKYYTTNAPNGSTINILIYLIPLLIAILALVVVARYMGFF